MNEVDLFKTQMPAHVTNAKSKAMQAMSSGMSGGFGNRISLRNSKFRFVQQGSDLGPIPDPTLEVVIFGIAPNLQRSYYAGAYDPGSKDKPTCFSLDNKTPSNDSEHKQSATCALCPQNVKGSGRMPGTKACAYKKRVVILSPDDIEGPMYALDVSGMSLFGEQDATKNLYSFKGYYEKLVAHNMDIAAIVTKLSFDDSASVPKLHFTPVRALTAEEFAQVQIKMEDDEVGRILNDVSNDMETEGGNGNGGTNSQVAQSKQQVLPKPAAPQGVGGLIQDVAPSVTAAKKGGFPTRTSATAAQQQPVVQQQAAAQASKPIEVDLDSLVTFDD